MAGDINIKIAVDPGSSISKVDQLDKSLTDLGKDAVIASTSIAKIDPATRAVQTSLAKTAVEAAKLDSVLDKSKASSDKAGNALTNLGRVVQDAPFGFIGIQNNISPLLESFQRLKAETGSTGGAFKALAGSLTGAGGLGLAVSIGTSALTLLAQSGFFKTAKEADTAKEKVKAFSDAVKGIEESVAKEQAQILTLVTALETENLSRAKKTAALKELKSINPEYFGQLKEENGLITGLTSAYESYKNSIIATIQNKIDSKRLEDVLVRINSLTEQQQKNQVLIKSNEQVINDLYKKGGAEYTNQIKQQNEVLNNTSALSRAEKERDEILKQIAARGFAGEIKFDKEKSAKNAKETIDDVIARLRRELNAISVEEDIFGIDKSKDKIREIENAISTLVRNFKVDPKGSLIQGLFGEIKELLPGLQRDLANIKIKTSAQILIDEKQAEKELNDKLGKDARIKPIRIPIAIAAPDTQEALLLIGNFSKAFEQLGSSIGNALSGSTDVVNGFFSGIASLLAQSLKDLGKYIITSSALIAGIKKALNAAFAGNPALGIAVGIGLIAVGSALENAIPKFADGVTNFGGGLAVVGERGPELVRLPSGSDVIPNHQLNNAGAGRMPIEITGFGILRGNDIYMSYNRAAKTSQRNS